MEKKKAIVLLSGGQDSTTCLYWAKRNYDEVLAIGFDYGQKHVVELEQAQKIADRAQVPYRIFDMKGLLGGSSLTDHTKDHNAAHEKNAALPASFTAGRNAMFLTLAASLGFNEDTFDIITGVCQTDFSGYPDCRRVFIESIETTLSLAMAKDFRIHTPLMYITKAETWKLAKDLGCIQEVIDYSITDYNGTMTEKHEWGFGDENNPATNLRVKGYYEAKEKGWI